MSKNSSKVNQNLNQNTLRQQNSYKSGKEDELNGQDENQDQEDLNTSDKQNTIEEQREQMLGFMKKQLLQLQQSIQSIEQQIANQKSAREKETERLLYSEEMLKAQLDRENQLIEQTIQTDIRPIQSTGLDYIQKLQVKINTTNEKQNQIEQEIIELQLEIDQLRDQQREINSDMEKGLNMNNKLNLKLRDIENENYSLNQIRQNKQNLIFELQEDVDEMNSAIQKLIEVKGTLNKVIVSSKSSRKPSRNKINQNEDVSDDPFPDFNQKKQAITNQQTLKQNDEESFWYQQESLLQPSPLKLPKIGFKQY